MTCQRGTSDGNRFLMTPPPRATEILDSSSEWNDDTISHFLSESKPASPSQSSTNRIQSMPTNRGKELTSPSINKLLEQVDPETSRLIPESVARTRLAVLVQLEDEIAVVATTVPDDIALADQLSFLLARKV
ncbi:MAG: hypothetical protein FJ267_16090 [Planctomycetes bacterium]|nr:hypothetical protein [Planctomycetota bacterium]